MSRPPPASSHLAIPPAPAAAMAAGRRLLAHCFDPLDRVGPWGLGVGAGCSKSAGDCGEVSGMLRPLVHVPQEPLGMCALDATFPHSVVRAGPEMKWRLRDTRGSGLSRPRGTGVIPAVRGQAHLAPAGRNSPPLGPQGLALSESPDHVPDFCSAAVSLRSRHALYQSTSTLH